MFLKKSSMTCLKVVIRIKIVICNRQKVGFLWGTPRCNCAIKFGPKVYLVIKIIPIVRHIGLFIFSYFVLS